MKRLSRDKIYFWAVMLGYFENVIWLTIFSGISSEKVVYEFQNQIFHFHHQNKFILFSTQHATISWISFFPKSWDLDSSLRGCGTRVIDGLFFKFFEDKDEKIEDWFDPQPYSAIQPKARGLLHMEHEFIAHHIKEDSGLVHLIASMQPRKYSQDYSKHSMDFKIGWWIQK